MNAMGVVVIADVPQFPREIDRVPEERAVEILTPNRPDQPFDVRMRDWRIRHRLDLVDRQNTQVGEPAVESEQGVVVGADVLRKALAGTDTNEHPAYRDAIDADGFDAEANNAPSEDIHDEHHPMAAQKDGFAAKEIDAPKGYPWRGR